jgi:hypothetical protein
MAIHWKAGASPEEIATWQRRIQELIGVKRVPQVLLDLWAHSNGFHDEDVIFYSLEESLEHNELLEVAAFAPGHIVIASDGGSRIAVLRSELAAVEVLLNYMGNMKPDSMEPTGMTLQQWIDAGCPFESEGSEEFSPIEEVVVRLEQMPPGGLPELMRIRNKLSLDIPVIELKSISEELPYDLCTLSYIRALRVASEINEKGDCVTLRLARDPTKRLPMDVTF